MISKTISTCCFLQLFQLSCLRGIQLRSVLLCMVHNCTKVYKPCKHSWGTQGRLGYPCTGVSSQNPGRCACALAQTLLAPVGVPPGATPWRLLPPGGLIAMSLFQSFLLHPLKLQSQVRHLLYFQLIYHAFYFIFSGLTAILPAPTVLLLKSRKPRMQSSRRGSANLNQMTSS